jgi:hypothetical protein
MPVRPLNRRTPLLVQEGGKNLGVNGRIILKLAFKQWDRETSTGTIWHRIGTGGGLL